MAEGISICFTGDLVLPTAFVERAEARGVSPVSVLDGIIPVVRPADLVIVNLEGPIGTAGTPRPHASALLQNDGAILKWLRQFPVCVCNLANNHILDLGIEGLERTFRSLASNGLYHVGAGLNREQAQAELIVEIKGQKVAFLSYTTDESHVGSVLAGEGSPGASSLNPLPLALRQIRRMRSGGAYVVVSLHWGHEYFQYPSAVQVETCRAIAHAGATLVIGHHSHAFQGFEYCNNALILYSLGNLLLPPFRMINGRMQYRRRVTQQFLLGRADIDDRYKVSCQFHGGICGGNMALKLHSAERLKHMLGLLTSLSEPFKRSDYAEHWAKYRASRAQELEREALVQAVCRCAAMPFNRSLTTLSTADIKRNKRRLIKVAIGA